MVLPWKGSVVQATAGSNPVLSANIKTTNYSGFLLDDCKI